MDDVVYGCGNQAGEDNRNVARMAALLACLPVEVTGTAFDRLCRSGMDAVITAARAIKSGEAGLVMADGVEGVSRAPFVMPQAETAFSGHAKIHYKTISWRFIDPQTKRQYGFDPMTEAGDNVAIEFGISRQDQAAFALRSQAKAAVVQENGRLVQGITSVAMAHQNGELVLVARDEHPRLIMIDSLARLTAVNRIEGATVTLGIASGVNDGAAALIVATETAIRKFGLTHAPLPGRVSQDYGDRSGASSAQTLRQTRNVAGGFRRHRAERGLRLDMAALHRLGIDEDASYVDPNGGSIALGHPLCMSGARFASSAGLELSLGLGRSVLATTCIGVGQGGVAMEQVRRRYVAAEDTLGNVKSLPGLTAQRIGP